MARRPAGRRCRAAGVTWQVTVRPAAEADLAAAEAWYEDKRAGLGQEFLASVAGTLMRVESNPEQFPIYYRDFRRALVRRFPYKVFFRIVGDGAIVFRVLHAAGDHRRRL